ncbi:MULTISPECIES: hypothetical protein [unclassified Polynucleobacter]|uniref:hypothetical protein n=1 Tax=unclassified Polynucleobacter TaxID=2640945 RepID=UPI000AFA110D|nr:MULTISPECIES: hypothetical protein [unclassified Polynucleobacter]
MRFNEFSQPKPPTPEQTRVKSLQAQADRAKQAVKVEKAKQKIRAGQQALRAK